MAFLVLAYPTLAQADWAWIQALRKEHDQRDYAIVDPHFTLVFPVFNLAVESLVTHVQRQVAQQLPIPVVLRCAIVVKDQLSDNAQVFLTPDEGFSALVKLHDALYTGILRSELRLDIPFLPHIGIATNPDLAVCKTVADGVNAQGFCIRGQINQLEIVRYAQNRVETIASIPLDR
jgi:hypothetical protein